MPDLRKTSQKNPLPDCWQGILLSGIHPLVNALILKQGVYTLPASLGCLKSGLPIIWIAARVSLFNFLYYILPGLP
jgi:hypothetical protein